MLLQHIYCGMQLATLSIFMGLNSLVAISDDIPKPISSAPGTLDKSKPVSVRDQLCAVAVPQPMRSNRGVVIAN